MSRLCNCGSCEYCSAYLSYEMDLEFGVRSRVDSEKGRLINFFHHQNNEEMCREFGTGVTTYEERKKNQGPMPQGEEIVDALAKKSYYDL